MALTAEPDLCNFFERCVKQSNNGTESAKWLLNAGAKYANENKCEVNNLGITPQQLAGLIQLRQENKVGSSAADKLFGMLCDSDQTSENVAKENNLLQVTDGGAIDSWVTEAIEAQQQAADDVRSGKNAAIGRLVGEVMKRSGGAADAKTVREKLLQQLQG
jgi:aspartyl-tRNA(Asn)/glutamyl-tRNA(Gln) amidotransferase subunit B